MIRLFESLDAFLAREEQHSEKKEDALGSLLDEIQQRVRMKGDEAVHFYNRQYGGVIDMESLLVTEEERQRAYDVVTSDLVSSLQLAKDNVEKYHRIQVPEDKEVQGHEGVRMGLKYTSLETVGLYVPGGRALYPSTVIMNAVPAKVAGVSHTVMTTPPKSDGSIDPSLLVAADICGVSQIVKAGGAQSVFALAYGTASIPRVDKIVGPGNKYVNGAKLRVFGVVDIDKPAGPSEVLVYVQDSKYAAYAAAEMMAQLEHDPDAVAVVVSESHSVLDAVQHAFGEQLHSCSRRDIVLQAVANSGLLLSESYELSVSWINALASEHVVLLVDSAEDMMPDVKHAGALFLGPYTPVALGDYVAGTNHVLPTERAARFSSPLGVMDFMKYSSWVSYSKPALRKVSPALKTLTDHEQLGAHYDSVRIRLG